MAVGENQHLLGQGLFSDFAERGQRVIEWQGSEQRFVEQGDFSDLWRVGSGREQCGVETVVAQTVNERAGLIFP